MEMRTEAEPVGKMWRDQDGFVGGQRPGTGPRRDPEGDFPTGPEIGTPLPPVVALDTGGGPFDLHSDRDGQPAIVVFYRSAVW